MASSTDLPEGERPILTDDDKRLLKYLLSVTEAIRRQMDPPQSKRRNSFRDALREPGVVAALITVLIGGIAGALITGIIQWRGQVREVEQAWLKARGDQALISYKEYLDQEQGLIRRTYSLIGSCSSAADGLISVTRPAFRRKFLGAAGKTVEQQISEIRQNYNQNAAKWQSEQVEIGLLMGYFHPQKKEVTESWRRAQDSVTSYLECAQVWHDSNHPPKVPTEDEVNNACREERDALLDSINHFSDSLESTRSYAWAGWESPDRLKALLEGQNSTPEK